MTIQQRAKKVMEEMTAELPTTPVTMMLNPFLSPFLQSVEDMEEEKILSIINMIDTKIQYVKNGE